MIDFHAHILPGMDDGSRDIAMTEALLREEKRQGVELIAATPHFYADRMNIGGFLERRAEALEKTWQLIRQASSPLPQVIAGAEVYYFPGMGSAREITRLNVGETKTLLVELPFTQWNEQTLRDVEALIRRQKLNIVLAHVERYIGFQKDKRVWNRMLSLPLTPQINAGSFIRSNGFFHPDRKRKFCLNFLKEHPRTIVGSDCHDMESRAPNIAAAMKTISDSLGAKALTCIDVSVRDALGLVES